MDLSSHIGKIPDFPKEGILFYDIAPLLSDQKVFKETVSQVVTKIKEYNPELLLGIESRGFLFGPSIAQELGVPFGMIRKRGKLPGDVVGMEYTLEYGSDHIELQKYLMGDSPRTVIFDDLLATGGTMGAAIDLVNKAGGQAVAAAFLIELTNLKGREKISLPLETLMEFEG